MKKRVWIVLWIVIVIIFISIPTFADDPNGALINNSVTRGFRRLLSDALKLIMIAAPIVGGVVGAFISLKKSANGEEQMTEKYNKQLKNVLWGVIGAESASTIIFVIISYIK